MNIEQEINSLYAITTQLKIDLAVCQNQKANIMDKIGDFKLAFTQHDEKEMKKYESIDSNLRDLNKKFYIALGMGLFIQIVILPIFLIFVTRF